MRNLDDFERMTARFALATIPQQTAAKKLADVLSVGDSLLRVGTVQSALSSLTTQAAALTATSQLSGLGAPLGSLNASGAGSLITGTAPAGAIAPLSVTETLAKTAQANQRMWGGLALAEYQKSRLFSQGSPSWVDALRSSTTTSESLARLAGNIGLGYQSPGGLKALKDASLTSSRLGESLAKTAPIITPFAYESLQDISARFSLQQSLFAGTLTTPTLPDLWVPEHWDDHWVDDGWRLPGAPGTLEYPLLTAAGFRVITAEAAKVATYTALAAVYLTGTAVVPEFVEWANTVIGGFDLFVLLMSLPGFAGTALAWLRSSGLEDDG